MWYEFWLNWFISFITLAFTMLDNCRKAGGCSMCCLISLANEIKSLSSLQSASFLMKLGWSIALTFSLSENVFIKMYSKCFIVRGMVVLSKTSKEIARICSTCGSSEMTVKMALWIALMIVLWKICFSFNTRNNWCHAVFVGLN